MRKTTIIFIAVFILALLGSTGCDGDKTVSPDPLTRSFYMGFTPMPYAFNVEAVDTVYQYIADDADIICHHFDDGVPWVEALAGEPYHENVLGDISGRLARTPAGHKIYLAVGMLALDRYNLAGYWAEESGGELPPEWQGKAFDDPDVIAAYTNYCRYMISQFNPDYFAYGIEVNLGFESTDPKLTQLLTLVKTVYPILKAENPGMPIFLSISTATNSTIPNDLETVCKRFLEYSDYVAVSTYPFVFAATGDANPDDIPVAWFTDMADFAPEKPFAIAETCYIAEDLVIPELGINIHGTQEFQADYVKLINEQSNQLDGEFVIWFVIRDYDDLWEEMQGEFEPWQKMWRDTGMYDGVGNERESLTVWHNWLAMSKR